MEERSFKFWLLTFYSKPLYCGLKFAYGSVNVGRLSNETNLERVLMGQKRVELEVFSIDENTFMFLLGILPNPANTQHAKIIKKQKQESLAPLASSVCE